MKPRSRLVSCLLAILMLLQAFPALSEGILEKELERQQHRLKAVEGEISKFQQKSRQVTGEEHDVSAQIDRLDGQTEELWQALQDTKKDWTSKEMALVKAQDDCAATRKALGVLRPQIEKRLRAFYQMGTTGFLNILFASDSLSSMYAKETDLKLLLDQDRQLRADYQDRLAALEADERQLERDRQGLRAAAQDIESKAAALAEKKNEKRAYLTELYQQKAKYQALLNELEIARDSLEKIIDRFSATSYDGPNNVRQEDLHSFRAQKGRLNPPVLGTLMRPHLKTGHGDDANGVLIAAPWGSEIRAIFDGIVVYQGQLSGYGKVIVISHGDDYYSLIAQGSEFFKNTGDKVVEGELIGFVGGGAWISEGVYFEIRHGGQREDPVKWLDLRGNNLRLGDADAAERLAAPALDGPAVQDIWNFLHSSDPGVVQE